MEQQPTEAASGTIPRCHWHPDVETLLSCSRCNKPVCPQCVVQAPVGLRCRDCGRAIRTPTYDVGPSHLARSVAVAAGVAIGGGVLWWGINVSFLGPIPFLSPLFAVAVGYAAGELISRAINRKRGASLAWMAGGAVVAAFLISWLLQPFRFDIWGLLFIAAGIFIAVQRVR